MKAVKNSILLWENPLSAAVLAILIFFGLGLLGDIPTWKPSNVAYFNYLADAFLHGQLNLRIIPAVQLDLSLFQGKYYLYWGPLPAILAMPLVALFGVGVSDSLQSVAVAGIIAGLFAELLRQIDHSGWIKLSAIQRALLVALFVLGTSLTPLPGGGTVWGLSQLVALAFSLLAYIVAFTQKNTKAFFWMGLAVAAVLLTRLSAVLVAIFPAWYLLRSHWHQGWRRMAINCLAGVLPVLAALALLLAYNLARFGSPLDNGINYHLMSDVFRPLMKQYGYLSPHYVPGNFYYTYIAHPLVIYLIYQSGKVWGGSLFILSPLFFAAFPPLWQARRRWDTWVLLLVVLLGNIPAMMIMGPGTLQYGSRYALDFIIPLLLLTAWGLQRWHVRWVALLVGLSVLQYLPGAILIGSLG